MVHWHPRVYTCLSYRRLGGLALCCAVRQSYTIRNSIKIKSSELGLLPTMRCCHSLFYVSRPSGFLIFKSYIHVYICSRARDGNGTERRSARAVPVIHPRLSVSRCLFLFLFAALAINSKYFFSQQCSLPLLQEKDCVTRV